MKKAPIVAAVLLTGAVGSSAVIPTAAADANTTSSKVIIDTLNVIDKDRVARQINAQEFPDDKRISVFLTDDKSLTKDNFDNDLTKFVLNSKNSEITDGKTIKPNMLVIGWSPGLKSIRLLGGDNTGVNSDMTQKVYSSMIPLAKTLDYEEAIVTGARAISESYANPVATAAATSNTSPLNTTTSLSTEKTSNAQAPTTAASPTEVKKDSGDGVNILPWVLGLLALICVGVAIFLLRTRGAQPKELKNSLAEYSSKLPRRKAKEESSYNSTKTTPQTTIAPVKTETTKPKEASKEVTVKPVSSWNPPSLTLIEESLNDWRNLGRKYDKASVEKPEIIDTIILELTRLKKNHGVVTEEQRNNSNWTSSIDNSTIKRDKIIAKLDNISYVGGVEDWGPQWKKEYRSVISKPFLTLKNSIAKNSPYLSTEDAQAVARLLEVTARNSDKVDKAVMAGKVNPKDAGLAVKLLVKKLQAGVLAWTDKVEPVDLPEGMIFFKDARSMYSRDKNSFNLTELLWAPERFAEVNRKIPNLSSIEYKEDMTEDKKDDSINNSDSTENNSTVDNVDVEESTVKNETPAVEVKQENNDSIEKDSQIDN